MAYLVEMHWQTAVILAAAVIIVLCGAWWLWWRLPKRQVDRLRLTIRDPKARADVEDNFRKTIGQLLGGAAVLIGAGFAYLQFTQQQQASHEQFPEQQQEARDLLISNQVAKGFEQLGSDKVVVRLGGIYALEGVMNTSEQYYQLVLEALSAFVRDSTRTATGEWSGVGWGWGPGSWAWGSFLVGASIGVIVAPPLIVVPPPIYVAPPPVVAGIPYICPPPIAAAAPPVAAPSAPAFAPPPLGPLLGATVPPPIVVLPPSEIIVAVAPPLIIFTPPAFVFFGPPVLTLATVGPGWWDSGYATGGFAGVGAGAAIAHFGHTGPGVAGMPRGFHGRQSTRPYWANTWHGGCSGGWHGSPFGGWHGDPGADADASRSSSARS